MRAPQPPQPPQPPPDEPAPTRGDCGGKNKRFGLRARPLRRVPRLRIGLHCASPEALDRLQLAGSSFGLRLGLNQAGLPATVSLFRPEPTAVVLVGGAWAARFVVFRALKFGARVRVFTHHAAGWAQLGRAATGRADRMAVLDTDTASDGAASPDAPVLSVYDDVRTVKRAEPAGWHTRLTILRRLTPDRFDELPAADMTLLQRLTPGEAEIAAQALRLTPECYQRLRALPPDMMALLSVNGTVYLGVTTTDEEGTALGRPGRY